MSSDLSINGWESQAHKAISAFLREMRWSSKSRVTLKGKNLEIRVEFMNLTKDPEKPKKDSSAFQN